METYVRNIVFNCSDAHALASFYAELLGWRVITLREDYVVIARDEKIHPHLAFDEVPDYRPPRWPDPAYPQQVHLDIHVVDSEAAQALALRLGATRLPDVGGSCPVFADPAGHPFCLCSPVQ
ncbi:MAG TPA: VOC family protein [Actinomycetota bacterium]|nr:VOC family protein [Actinomycetota bacterium]